jgi:hypothetical protein
MAMTMTRSLTAQDGCHCIGYIALLYGSGGGAAVRAEVAAIPCRPVRYGCSAAMATHLVCTIVRHNALACQCAAGVANTAPVRSSGEPVLAAYGGSDFEPY